jgi:NADH:ubiquinone oxidoreductase subunit 5 (subunit L)/multisubunit Na+/H+ antiporter MnhA subunit
LTATHIAQAPVAEAIAYETASAHHIEPIEYLLMLLSLGIAGLGIYLGIKFYGRKSDLPVQWGAKLKPLYKLSFNKWYWDYLLDVKGVEAGKAVNNGLWAVDAAVVDGGVNGTGWLTRFSAKVSDWWDRWVVDLAVNMTGWSARAGSLILRAFQTGFWQNYALIFVLGLFILMLVFIYPAFPVAWKALTGK